MNDESTETRERSTLKGHVGWWIATLSGIAGIIALAIGIPKACEDDGITPDEWRQKASGVCERQLTGVNAGLISSAQWISYWASQLASSQATQIDAANAVAATQTASATFKTFIGSLREIDQPEKMKEDIRKALDTGSYMMDSLGAAVVNVQSGKLADASSQLSDTQSKLAVWHDQMRDLGADHCAR